MSTPMRRAGAVGLAVLIAGAVLGAPSSAASAPAVVPAASGGPATRAADLVRGMTTAEQAASVIMGHIPSTDPAALSAYMAQGFGGFIMMGANVPEVIADLPSITGALSVDPSLPPLIAIDQEGGIVSRLSADTYPSSTSLKSAPPDAVAAAFAARASLVRQAGISVNFGTVADVTADPSSFIFGRALGTDPQASAERVAAATAAQEPFLASTLKHFPGHGAAPGDSHHAIPSTSESLEQWRVSDAVPFAAGVDADASLLMFGHLAYTAIDSAPASLSARWHEIARDDLGFDGVIVTDDLGMLLSSGIPEYRDPAADAVAALAAGNDLVLMIAGSTPDTAGQMAAGIVAGVEGGTLPAERLADAATRVLTLRLKLSAASAGWVLCATCEPVS